MFHLATHQSGAATTAAPHQGNLAAAVAAGSSPLHGSKLPIAVRFDQKPRISNDCTGSIDGIRTPVQQEITTFFFFSHPTSAAVTNHPAVTTTTTVTAAIDITLPRHPDHARNNAAGQHTRTRQPRARSGFASGASEMCSITLVQAYLASGSSAGGTGSGCTPGLGM